MYEKKRLLQHKIHIVYQMKTGCMKSIEYIWKILSIFENIASSSRKIFNYYETIDYKAVASGLLSCDYMLRDILCPG